MVTRLLACIGVLVAPVLAMAQPLGDRVPENAIIYVGWQGGGAMPPAYEQSHLKGVLDASNVPALFNDFVPRLIQRVAKDEPEAAAVMKLVVAVGGPLWRHPSAVFFSGVDFKGADGPRPKFGIICQAGDEADALAAQFKSLLEGPMAGFPFPAKVFKQDGLVVFAVGYDQEDMVLADKQAANKPKPISGSAKLQQALAQVNKDPLFVLYVDAEAAMAQVDESLRFAGDAEAQAAWGKAREVLGLGGLKRIILTGGLDGRDWGTQCFIAAPAPRGGVLGMLGGKALSDDAMKLVPASVVWVNGGQVDLGAIMDGIRGIGGSFDPRFVAEFDKGVAEINKTIGMDLRKDVVGAFGSEWIGYIDPPSTGSGMLGVVMVNRLAKAAEAEKALTKLEEWANQAIAREMARERIQMAFVQTRIGSLNVHTISLPGFAPSWAVKDGMLYAGLYPQTVAGAAQAEGKGKSILDNPAFVGLRKRLGAEGAMSFTFADLPQTAPEAYQVLLMMSQFGIGMADMYGVKTPPLVIPPLKKLLEHLSPAAEFFWVDDTGWHYKSLAPFPGAELLSSSNNLGIATSGMMVSIMLPALNAAKERANRVKCASNLRQIGQGMMLYANDNKGKFPPDLGTLVKEADLNAEVFICSSGGSDLPDSVRQGKVEDAVKWANQSADYVYLGANRTVNNTTGDTILAYEKAGSHGGEGMNLLYGDGHVEWWPGQRGMEMVEKQQGK